MMVLFSDQGGRKAQNLAQARVLVAEANGSLRQSIRGALSNLGILEIHEANGYGKTRQSLELGGFDAVILNADLDGRDACALVRELRLGGLGPDPFVVVILLLAGADPARLRHAVDCGSDDLLLVPFSPGQMAKRLDSFKARRKPFVITHDYVGPDRRVHDRQPQGRSSGAAAVSLVPPNPLEAKASGMAPEHYARLKSQATQTLRLERIRRLAVATEWECRRMIGATTPQGHPAPLSAAFDKLERLLDELVERLPQASRRDGRAATDMRGLLHETRARQDRLQACDFDALHAAARRLALAYTSA